MEVAIIVITREAYRLEGNLACVKQALVGFGDSETTLSGRVLKRASTRPLDRAADVFADSGRTHAASSPPFFETPGRSMRAR